MDQSESAAPPPPPPPVVAPPIFQPPPSGPQHRGRLARILGPLGVVGVLLLKFFAKLKFLLLPILKFLPVLLKTGGTMLLSIWLYARVWGVWFALGFVLLIFIHECGHLLAAKRL